MRTVEGSLGHSPKQRYMNWKDLVRDKARLGALRVGWVEYCAQLDHPTHPLWRDSSLGLACGAARLGGVGETSELFEHPAGLFSCCAVCADH